MHLFVFTVVILIFSAAAVAAKKLTPFAAVTGCCVATGLFFGTGWAGVALMAAFFGLATMATSAGKQLKIGNAKEPPRNAGQVLANGGLAGLAGAVCWLTPAWEPAGLLLIAAAFSSATADTVSSELGTVYGKRFYDVMNFGPGQRGANGVVSLEGSLCGLMGSVVIATVYLAFAGWSLAVFWIVVAGTFGNLADSVLGAVWEKKGLIGNNAVNFLNTLAAAGLMWLCSVAVR